MKNTPFVADYAATDHEAIVDFVRTELHSFPLTKAEACVLCDANNGAMLFPDYCWTGLAANIEDTPASSLSEKWGCDAMELARKVSAASRATQFCVAYAVAQFWRNCERDIDELLPECGFRIVEVTL